MSFVRLGKRFFEHVSLKTRPKIEYVTSSAGVTGTMYLSPRPSKSNKQITDPTVFTDAVYSNQKRKVNKFLRRAAMTASAGETNIESQMLKYMEIVHSQSKPTRDTKKFNINRFEPPFTYKLNTTIKNITQNVLMPYYRASYDNCEFSYTNYHTINFFTASSVPSNSAFIYPNFTSSIAGKAPYNLEEGFTFDFYINPRYTNENDTATFKAGTILHLSSCYAVSLVSGSLTDDKGRTSGYRILLQLSHSADISPSKVDLSLDNNTRPRDNGTDLCFLSADNSLKRNHWHHISIRWGTNQYNAGSGSIIVDDFEYGFCVPSASIDPVTAFADSTNPPEVLFVGNYYEGTNVQGGNAIKAFFNTTVATDEGLRPAEGFTTDPAGFQFDHPLNAEIHDLKIYAMNIPKEDVDIARFHGVGDLSRNNLRLYVPPFFVQESRQRQVPVTPFQTINSYTDDPFNVSYSFGVGGHLLNLENFMRDFAEQSYPRLYNLTSSTIDTTITADLTANDYLYGTGSIRKRNLTILPNDNGIFTPNHSVLLSGSESDLASTGSAMRSFKNSMGNLDLSIIDLSDLIPTGSLFEGLIQESGSILDEIIGASPSNPGVAPGSVLTIFQRTRDGSSNEMTFFDISNLYYGDKISPTTFKIKDSNLSGSDGKVKMTLVDNGRGALYRADALTEHATTSFVGNIFYDEGLVIVKSPNIPFFGKGQHEITCRGERNVHILTLNVPCKSGMINSSSNPTFLSSMTASADPNDDSQGFVYLTGINFHDENLNVVMRTSLAQPVVKRFEDEFLFKVKMDY